MSRGWTAGRLTALAGIALLVSAPAWMSTYFVSILTIALIYGILAVSLDLSWGYAGILSLGHAVFFGVGTYAVGFLSTEVSETTGLVSSIEPSVTNLIFGAVLGALFSAVIAAVLCWLSFFRRTSSPLYVAVVTLALTIIAVSAVGRIDVLGGSTGLFGFALHPDRTTLWFYVATVVLAVSAYVVYRLVTSDLGAVVRAVRDNEERARYLGYDVRLVKSLVFILSAMLAALAGALFGGLQGIASPPLLGFLFATQIVIWVAVGGRGTLVGPMVGAIAIQLVGSKLSEWFPSGWPIALGLLFVLVVVAMPDGLYPGARSLLHRISRQGEVGVRGFTVTETAAAAPQSGRRDGATVLQLSNLRRSYGALQVLRGVDLTVAAGEMLCIVGANGAGKSTLLSVLSDGSSPFEGEATLSLGSPSPLAGQAPQALVRLGVGRNFQTPSLFDTLTVGETMLVATQAGRLPSAWRRSKNIALPHAAFSALTSAGLHERLHERVDELPHGSKKALELAATLALNPRLVLLDEPTAGLTAEERLHVGRLLSTIVNEFDVTVVIIEHDFEFVQSIASRMAVLHDGRVVLAGPTSEVAGSAMLKDIYLGGRK